MVYMIVATVQLILNTLPAGEPYRITHKLRFDHIEQCQAFLVSPSFTANRAALAKMLQDAIPEGEYAPTVTITTACEVDTSI